MISLQPPRNPRTLTPNLLPCTIHHNGPLKIAKRYWEPQPSSEDTKTSTAYLRGRKLRGRVVKLPKGYRGYLLQKTERDAVALVSSETGRGGERVGLVKDDGMGMAGGDEEEDEVEEVKVMEQKAVFDEMVVWGHEVLPEDGDEYVKGVEEWIAFAEAIHGNHRTADGEEASSVPVLDRVETSQNT
ncbi:hypothetical protein LTR91_004513 [Friedmanniomyces endolithicus]|uniref:Uncharacterized protein n=1 Tax=Friedmanniomyces endolithicus TaxID=329885 RepID=A0AAN6KVT8_9PEZI|nr:hypothetical protein LTR57_008552 [Friedmanniomyces endolithicus]KAK0999208.1 hypothetical protein LTS01_005502 [Friedmanniomyces endolithicus]KAK1004067.1 hypothetical protein LTR91_004513 [Friedmanniomyces endolithicus]KAK1040524.1 hypothetical protein LTS16_010377 [Friedmanniomyces endolithicus]